MVSTPSKADSDHGGDSRKLPASAAVSNVLRFDSIPDSSRHGIFGDEIATRQCDFLRDTAFDGLAPPPSGLCRIANHGSPIIATFLCPWTLSRASAKQHEAGVSQSELGYASPGMMQRTQEDRIRQYQQQSQVGQFSMV